MDRIRPGRPGAGRTQRSRPHGYPRRRADRDLAGTGTGAHRPRWARGGGGPYGDCQAGRSLASTRKAPFTRKRPEAHLWQRRRTIGRQVGTNAQFMDMEIHRFQ
ncbi:hypothetical protein GCM10009574_052830 [Streptomyces asiaticus]|uniref:Uncharacterized protein n=2 Tax=Streptomyces rhizosphaericus TaxID=114699 RepID=A0ABN1QB25_9ACTN